MTASLDHAIAKAGLVVDATIMAVEVIPPKSLEWFGDAPGTGEEEAAIARGQEGEYNIADTGDGKSLCASAEFGRDGRRGGMCLIAV